MTAAASEGRLFVKVTEDSWYVKNEPKYQMKIVAHEMFHVYTQTLRTIPWIMGSDIAVYGPSWISEGIVEYLAYKSISEGEIMSYELERPRIVEDAKSS